MNALCPVCENDIELGFPPKIGHLANCQVCKTTLEVIWLFPVSLEPVEEQSHTLVNAQDDMGDNSSSKNKRI